MMKKIILFLVIISFSQLSNAKKFHHEKWYQNYQCERMNGKVEFRPEKDRYVRIDCELTNYSVEVDFATKHYEAVGQSLYYSYLTKKRAGIWLIIEKRNQIKHVIRLVRNIRANRLPITVWIQRVDNADQLPTFELYYTPPHYDRCPLR